MSRRLSIALCACLVGLLLITYGMVTDRDLIFLLGVGTTGGGYLAMRSEIKAFLQDKHSKDRD